MFCPKCGAQLPDGSQFCGKCGAQLADRQPVQSAPQNNPAQAGYNPGVNGGSFTNPSFSNPSFTAPRGAAGSGVDGRNIGAVLGGVLTVVGFALPWVATSSLGTYGSSLLSGLGSLAGKSVGTLADSYNLFTILTAGTVMDSYGSTGGAYTIMFGIMSLVAILVTVLLVIGAVLMFTSKGSKVGLLRAGGIFGAVGAVGVAIFLMIICNSGDMGYILSFQSMGAILAAIGGIVAVALPHSVK